MIGRLYDACDGMRSKGEEEKKEKVKQKEINDLDKIRVAGLGPRAVLAAGNCWLVSLARGRSAPGPVKLKLFVSFALFSLTHNFLMAYAVVAPPFSQSTNTALPPASISATCSNMAPNQELIPRLKSKPKKASGDAGARVGELLPSPLRDAIRGERES